MSHFLWIEDFDRVTVEELSGRVFLDVLTEVYNPDKIGRTDNVLIKELEKHGVYIKKNFEIALNYIRQNISKIDYIIIDINLPAKIRESNEVIEFLRKFYDADNDKLSDTELVSKEYDNFVLNSGFYLFTELVCEFGFPKKHIKFYSNHGNDQNIIKNKFKEAGITLPDIYLKQSEDHKEIRNWVKSCCENPYSRLRRGIIDACSDLKDIAGDENNLQINDYAKDKISSTDIINYLDTLSQLLPISKPDDLNLKYRIFLRTLAHEWDICIISKEDRNGEKHSTSIFVETMKMVRNWVAHDKLLEPLNEEIISFLFVANMRAMFKLENNLKKYELKLLNCISASQFLDAINNQKIKEAEKYVDDLLKKMPNVKLDNNHYIREYFDKQKNPKTDKFHKNNFNQKINCLHNEKQPINLKYGYQQLLLQYFFDSHLKYKSDWLKNISNSSDFLPTLARHIYSRSFLKNTEV